MTKLKSNLGEKLVAIREKAIANGMKLKSAEEITGGGGVMPLFNDTLILILFVVGIISGVVRPDIDGFIFIMLVVIYWRLKT